MTLTGWAMTCVTMKITIKGKQAIVYKNKNFPSTDYAVYLMWVLEANLLSPAMCGDYI